MILENWTALEIIVGCVAVLVFGSGPAFAWTDRWLDRTRNVISDVVSSKKDKEE